MLPKLRKKKKKEQKKKLPISPSSIETIDVAMYRWVDEKKNVFCTTNKGWKKVPVAWSTAERANQTKDSRERRDPSGQLILPIITVERTGIVKDMARKGPYWANIPPNDNTGNVLVVSKKINQKKTKNFQNADAQRKYGQINFKTEKANDKIVYQHTYIPQPIYIDVTYKVTIWTEYQQQMNEIVQPFMTAGKAINYDVIEGEGHRYEIFIGNTFTQEDNVANMEEDERKYQTTIEIKALGTLIGDGPNQDTPQTTVKETIVEVKIPRERALTDEESGEWDKSKLRS